MEQFGLGEVIWKCSEAWPGRLAEAMSTCPTANIEIPLAPRHTVFLSFNIPQPVNPPWK